MLVKNPNNFEYLQNTFAELLGSAEHTMANTDLILWQDCKKYGPRKEIATQFGPL